MSVVFLFTFRDLWQMCCSLVSSDVASYIVESSASLLGGGSLVVFPGCYSILVYLFNLSHSTSCPGFKMISWDELYTFIH